jgi:hypothetical protein
MLNKNCIIVTGQYRTFSKTKENLKNFIEHNNLDVYCHLWSNSESEIQDVIDTLKPTKIIVEDFYLFEPSFIDTEKRIKEKFYKEAAIDKLVNQFSLHYARKTAFGLIDTPYDNIVYTRYDVQIASHIWVPHKLDTVVTPIEGSWGIISDMFAILPQQHAKYWFIYDKLEDFHTTMFDETFLDFARNNKKWDNTIINIHQYERYCVHIALLRNFVSNNVPFEEIDLPVYIQR